MRASIKYLTLIFLTLVSFRSAFGQEMSATQYQLKAVFLYNFTQFVEWPQDGFNKPEEPFVIGLFGPDPFGNHLEEAVRNEKVQGHPIRIVSIDKPDEMRHCHMIFIHKSRSPEIGALLPALKSLNILTVSDAAGFCREGGMIGFSKERNKIRLQVNMDAAAAASLRISSKLLRLAEIISPKS